MHNLGLGWPLSLAAAAIRVDAVAWLKPRMVRWLFVTDFVVSHFVHFAPLRYSRYSSCSTHLTLMPPLGARLAAKSLYCFKTFKARLFPSIALFQSCK